MQQLISNPDPDIKNQLITSVVPQTQCGGTSSCSCWTSPEDGTSFLAG